MAWRERLEAHGKALTALQTRLRRLSRALQPAASVLAETKELLEGHGHSH